MSIPTVYNIVPRISATIVDIAVLATKNGHFFLFITVFQYRITHRLQPPRQRYNVREGNLLSLPPPRGKVDCRSTAKARRMRGKRRYVFIRFFRLIIITSFLAYKNNNVFVFWFFNVISTEVRTAVRTQRRNPPQQRYNFREGNLLSLPLGGKVDCRSVAKARRMRGKRRCVYC